MFWAKKKEWLGIKSALLTSYNFLDYEQHQTLTLRSYKLCVKKNNNNDFLRSLK